MMPLINPYVVRAAAISTACTNAHLAPHPATPHSRSRQTLLQTRPSASHLDQVSRAIEELYQLPQNSVMPKNENEPHLIKYEYNTGKRMKGIQMHHDTSAVTINIALSNQGTVVEEGDYAGGGTYFENLGKTAQLSKGQGLLHKGSLRHQVRTERACERGSSGHTKSSALMCGRT